MKLRHAAWRSIAVLSIAVAWIGCAREEAPRTPDPTRTASPTDGAARLLLDRFPTGRGVFEFSLSPKTPEGYGFDITWQEAGKPPSTVTMPVFAATQQGKRETVDLDWGAESGRAWATGMENDRVSTVARPIALDDDTTGLLVTQKTGFEDIKHFHRLIVPSQGKLTFAWEFDEGVGPTWSATIALPRIKEEPGRMALLSCHFGEIIPSRASRISMSRFVWDKTKARLVPAGSPKAGRSVAKALLIGNFKSYPEAKRQADAVYPCLESSWILSRDSIRTLPPGRLALVRLFTRAEDAQLEKRRLTDCGITMPMRIVDY